MSKLVYVGHIPRSFHDWVDSLTGLENTITLATTQPHQLSNGMMVIDVLRHGRSGTWQIPADSVTYIPDEALDILKEHMQQMIEEGLV